MARRTSPGLGLALGLAWGLFALTFRGPKRRFWDRMTATGITLGSLALDAQPELRRTRINWRDALWGAASAGVLYLIFQLGDRVVRRVVPRGGSQIGEIYSLRHLRPRGELMARLAFIIAPAEELFWHGYVQDALSKRWGRLRGFIASALAYGGVHLVSGNLPLIGAAVTAGAFWGGLRALGFSLGGLIVSHVVWDNLIFLIAPTSQAGSDTPR
jgi:membrane protease YdiL (CAAX protease family)